jgi:hypothetical protein
MLLDTYASQALLFNSNFMEPAGPGLQAYRGDLVLIEGEIADAMGRRKPPLALMVGAALLGDAEKLKFVTGSLDTVAHLPALIGKYANDFAADVIVMLFVVDIAKPMLVEDGGARYVLLPLDDGLAWNQLVDELRLEKSDFKGQTGGEKVATLYQACQDYAVKFPSIAMAEALNRSTGAKRVIHGAV